MGRLDKGLEGVHDSASSLRGLRVVGLTAAGLFVTFAVRELAWLVSPMLLAVVLVVIVYPVYTSLRLHRVPAALSVIALLAAIYGLVMLIAAVVVYALARFASLLPSHASHVEEIIDEAHDTLDEFGIAAPQARELLQWIDVAAAARWLTEQIPSLVSLLSMVVLVGTVLISLGIESAQLTSRARLLSLDHPRLYAALTATMHRTRVYFAVTTVFAIIVGVLNTILLLMLDVPLAPLWGLLSAVGNYIPFFGFWIGMLPPALLALAVHGWPSFLIVVVAYLVLNFLITTLLPTKFVGDVVDLSMTVQLVSTVFWGWVLGPIGAILGIPLTILLKAVLVDDRPGSRWLGGLIGSAPPTPTTAQ
ncbi:AI-2E family transporter [uncultured Aeromicrobium sp.]|uniref:AI-2E family transporter n=1 Tax=uncultured Aeromicrobium sp. TaxID=337820 RepID=UPI0025D8600E|nr:AI-2E family transporter [uncultured Aeromicrobium sp.]